MLFEEDDEEVAVLVLVCGDDDPGDSWTNCPVHIYLERPLGERVVRDVTRGGLPVPYYNVYDEMKRDGLLDPERWGRREGAGDGD